MGDAAVSQFIGVTGASEEAAHFFLESAVGDVAAAIDQCFATGGQMDDPAAAAEAAEGGGAHQAQEAPPGTPHAPVDPGSCRMWWQASRIAAGLSGWRTARRCACSTPHMSKGTTGSSLIKATACRFHTTAQERGRDQALHAAACSVIASRSEVPSRVARSALSLMVLAVLLRAPALRGPGRRRGSAPVGPAAAESC